MIANENDDACDSSFNMSMCKSTEDRKEELGEKLYPAAGFKNIPERKYGCNQSKRAILREPAVRK